MPPSQQERRQAEGQMGFGDARGEHEDDRPPSLVTGAPVPVRERQSERRERGPLALEQEHIQVPIEAITASPVATRQSLGVVSGHGALRTATTTASRSTATSDNAVQSR